MTTVWSGVNDAFGMALRDRQAGQGGFEVDERDDGFLAVVDLDYYFATCPDWAEGDQWAIGQCRGRVLDAGCGAGRCALHLQERGHQVVAIDVSDGAVDVCRARGVRTVHQRAIAEVSADLGSFDTILLLGNNTGLLTSGRLAPVILRKLSRVTSPGGRIIASAFDPYRTTDAAHLAYHDRNRRRGRMPGQVRMRVRYLSYHSPWFDWLLLSSAELEALAAGAGWRLAAVHESEGPGYVAVLEKA